MTQSEIIYRQFAKEYNYEYYVNNKGAELFFWKKGSFAKDRSSFESNKLTAPTLSDVFEMAFLLVGLS